MNELQIYILLIILAALFMLLLALTYLLICCDKNIGSIFTGYVKGFFWNGYIRFQDITYLPQAMAVGTQIRLTLQNNTFQQNIDKQIAMVIGTHCLLYPLNLMRILFFNSEEVRT